MAQHGADGLSLQVSRNVKNVFFTRTGHRLGLAGDYQWASWAIAEQSDVDVVLRRQITAELQFYSVQPRTAPGVYARRPKDVGGNAEALENSVDCASASWLPSGRGVAVFSLGRPETIGNGIFCMSRIEKGVGRSENAVKASRALRFSATESGDVPLGIIAHVVAYPGWTVWSRRA